MQKQKVIVLGASGMLGHRMCCELAGKFDVTGYVRSPSKALELFKNKYGFQIVQGPDPVAILPTLLKNIDNAVVINCIGAIKQLGYDNSSAMIALNALLPHQLSEICKNENAFFIHFSTDCVFTGDKGNYSESDAADATDVYGLSKYLGEKFKWGLTLRTSIIGRELRNCLSLLEWSLAQPQGSEVKGFRKAIFSGFPTPTLARITSDLIESNDLRHGTYNISVDPIDKFTLLNRFNQVWQKGWTVHGVDEPKIDRSLSSEKFNRDFKTKYNKNWNSLIDDLLVDGDIYDQLRSEK